MTRTSGKHDGTDFSLVKGGLLYRLFRFLKVAGEDRLGVLRRIILFFLLAWLPLIILSVAEGTAINGRLDIPFFLDLGANIRIMAAVPLFLIGEIPVDRWLKEVVEYMRRSGLVPDKARPAFDDAIRKVSLLRDSVVPELVLFLPVIVLFLVGPALDLPEGITSWKATDRAGTQFTLAGWWYALVSLPIYQFLHLRWLWRFVIWAYFLWRLARLPLQILPTHPDRTGGLGFMTVGHSTFSLVIFASSSVVAASLAEQIMVAHASLFDFQVLIATYVVLVLVVVLAPLCFFSPVLSAAKRRGLSSYATLIDQHHRLFAEKWFRARDDKESGSESILGNPDASSLADINSGYEAVHKMTILVVTPRLVIDFARAAVLPMAPLVLTVIPFRELLKKLAGLLM